ncbi:helix-turn-helix transcriptional regulator [Qingshengfaniella alkalisoli]|uniref:helix-turn-helix transcriptional regulator n=1 Tax=Qingshengfaniella alkalisoli TaxID=2599296 RepID=UPI001F0E2135|nr:LuxR C-terminal-related transcriptional regulator [Qingshengfaniella alkalisoli]
MLRGALSFHADFDSLVVTEFAAGGRPNALFHDLDEVRAAIHVAFYESGPYLLDPFYLACCDGLVAGVYRLLDLAPKAFFRSEYYRTFYRRVRIKDELGIVLRNGDTRWIIMSLARGARRPVFDDHELAALSGSFQTISAAVLRHWSGSADPGTKGLVLPLEQRMTGFAGDALSPREAEVLHLVLLGHSTPSAAAQLGIAEGTVKVHRRHAYSKLGISSQAELFSRVTRYLAEGGATG